MENTSGNKYRKSDSISSGNICIGMLAHVDAGKTTLNEALLYNSGAIRNIGRVDHRDTFLDTDPIERDRGITVYSKLARMNSQGREYTLVDTPGHADLSPEMERSLWILDYAVLIISAQDKVTSQDRLLWKLLEHNKIPAFIFVNKMDSPGSDREDILKDIHEKLSGSCIDFGLERKGEEFQEQAALTDERLLDKMLDGSLIDDNDIKNAVRDRKLFPVLFGSALKNDGVNELIECMNTYMIPPVYNAEFGARVYKISRDTKGTKMAWLKLTGGDLSVRQVINYSKNEEEFSEKINQIRLYSGESFEAAQTVGAGGICAVTGLSHLNAGDVLGAEAKSTAQIIEPVLTYEIEYPDTFDTAKVLEALRIMEEEEPKLHVRLSDKTGRISVQVMGQIQMEILKRRMQERFDIPIGFGSSTIIYKETISKPVVGVGHFEPLRHYAEVRLLIEPIERGSGLQLENMCKREELEPHWQRLIMSHLEEKIHTGVLTDSELTDVRISLLGGRAHTKHTESGDFRQATFRAIRQGLMESVSILLEPYVSFVLTVPENSLGKALFDLDQMGAENEAPVIEDGQSVIYGRGPAAELGNYQEKLSVYTSGKGRITCSFDGYESCHNAEEVIEEIGYDPERDMDNPSFSVFCSHGAGVIVPWHQVKEKMHTQISELDDEIENEDIDGLAVSDMIKNRNSEKELSYKERTERIAASEKELQEIFSRTYGSKGEAAKRPGWKLTKRHDAEMAESFKTRKNKKPVSYKEYLLVDGYNIIFAWKDLQELSEKDIGAARDRLMDVLSNYQGMTGVTLILVFDAYKVPGGKEAVSKYHNIYVVYTGESETADQYIEKTVHEIGKDNRVTVATSDRLEQMIILGEGAVRMSADGLLKEIETSRQELHKEFINNAPKGRNFLMDNISDEVLRAVKNMDGDTDGK